MRFRKTWVVLSMVAVSTPAVAAQKEQAWRTRVPAITAERWTQAPPPIPKARRVTRADYLRAVRRIRAVTRKGRLAKADDHTERFKILWARREAFEYSVTNKEEHARNAARFLRTALRHWTEGPGAKSTSNARYFIALGNAYREIRTSRSLTPDDHQVVRKLFGALERRFYNWEQGAFNRATAGAGACKILMHFCPESSQGKLSQLRPGQWSAGMTRAAYAKQVWGEWLRYHDSDENSAGYNALWLSDIASVLTITEQDKVLEHPALKKLAQRHLMQMTPIGAMPSYGDAISFFPKPVYWIALMEKWATVYQDGQFKWAAHRMMDYYLRHQEDYKAYDDPFVEHLIDAHQWADDSVAEQVPTAGSMVTYRKAIYKTSQKVQRKLGRWFDLSGDLIPNKLIFRTGWQPQDTFAMIDLCPAVGHGHRDTGAVTSLTSQGSVLLFDTPYLVKDHRYHDCFVMVPDERPKGWTWHNDTYHGRRTTVRVADFHAANKAGYARVHITNYMNLGATLDRRLFFLGDAGLWVRDTVTPTKPFRGKAGPAFQFVGVCPGRGENWVNACQTSLPGADIWTHQYQVQVANRPWDLLVWFRPDPDATLVIDDVTHDDSGLLIAKKSLMNNFTRRVWHQRTSGLRPGRAQTFDSVLVPHRPMASAEPLARGIQSMLDAGPDRAVIKIEPRPGRTLYVGINRDGEPLTVGPVKTDARWFLLAMRNGRAAGHWVVEARQLTVGTTRVHSSPARQSVDEWR